MSLAYFAYGSNLWLPRIQERCPSAEPIGPTWLHGWALVFDKPSTDGSAKANIREVPGTSTPGVLYEIDPAHRILLDHAEPLYAVIAVEAGGREAFTYAYEGEPTSSPPYDWYLDMIVHGRSHHDLPTRDLTVPSIPDPRPRVVV